MAALAVPVTSGYAAGLGVVFIVLSFLAGHARGKSGISLGDGGKPELIEAIRRHANFFEYVPFLLVMMVIIELNGAPKSWLHALGALILISRIAHPFGMHYNRSNGAARFIGATGTLIALLAVTAIAGWQALAR